MKTVRFSSLLLVLGALLAFGFLKTPLEQRLLMAQRAAHLQQWQLNANIRAQLGQTGFIAALSGFRAVMADLLWIRAGMAFERTQWPVMQWLMHSVTRLQPRGVIFWEMAHFHMAYDAATAARENEAAQPNTALRRKAEQSYLRIGEEFLKDGILFNPDSSRLYQRLAELYSRRMGEHLQASQAYARAAELPKAMGYLRRMSAYELAKVPGRETEAYERLRDLYLEGESQRLPTLLILLAQLEEKLAVPLEQRVYIPRSASEPPSNPP